MPTVRLKGLKKVTAKGRDGRLSVYWYAWVGGPRLEGAPGSPEFVASYNRAVADRRAPKHDDLAGLVAKYKAAPEFLKLSEATRVEWNRWLDRIALDVGPLDIGGIPVKLLDDRRIRADLLQWRDQWADRPRMADYAMQVLGRVLSWSLDRGLIALNPAAGVSQLYESDRADQIWIAAELAAYRAAAPSPEVAFIVRLACLTGLRRSDLTRLAWSHVGDVAIVLPTGKSRGRKTQTIPLMGETRALLAEIRAQQLERLAKLREAAKRKKRPEPAEPLTVLTNTRGKPWSPDGLETQVIKTKAAATPAIDKHLHDARGTFATRLRGAGLTASEIADVLAWEEDRVERLLATYVDRDSIVTAIAERIRKSEEQTR